jgi:SAM-dependent methyltransferase
MDQERLITYEEERVIYDLHQNSIENEGYVNMFRDFLEAGVLPYAKTGNLLDFGSGPEPVLATLLERDYLFQVAHYDLHYQPIKVYAGVKYDVILATEVIEHLPNPLDVIRLIHSLLKKGGIFSFMTLIHANDEGHFLEWWYRRDMTHISFYTQKTLDYIAGIVGFEVIYTDNKRIITYRKL